MFLIDTMCGLLWGVRPVAVAIRRMIGKRAVYGPANPAVIEPIWGARLLKSKASSQYGGSKPSKASTWKYATVSLYDDRRNGLVSRDAQALSGLLRPTSGAFCTTRDLRVAGPAIVA